MSETDKVRSELAQKQNPFIGTTLLGGKGSKLLGYTELFCR